MLRISFFDWTDYDDHDVYSQFGVIKKHNRFNWASAADADVIFTTFSRPPDIPGTIVNLASSDRRHLSHIVNAKIIQARPWNTHDVARWTLDRIPADARRVAVVGRGAVGLLVARYLHSRGVTVFAVGHTVRAIPPVDVITLHTLLSPQTSGRFGSRLFVNQRGATLINSARPGLVPVGELANALRNGQLRVAHLDGGSLNQGKTPGVIVTPHVAWRGSRSRVLRPFRVVQILRQLSR